MKACYRKRALHFKVPGGTSRGVLTEKPSWILEIWNDDNPSIKGIGECSVIPGLSPDYINDQKYETILNQVCENINTDLTEYPSIKFGLESALLDLNNGGTQRYYDTDFYKGESKIAINGLIWMGTTESMLEQISQKIDAGFTTIKMKIGAITLDEELRILEGIRGTYNKEEITLRVDANGAFDKTNIVSTLEKLAALDIHSIEQPIKKGDWKFMKDLCKKNILPIALDEELIGIHSSEEKNSLLEEIRPQFIILKPSLHGGLSGTKEWIHLAEDYNVGWWGTSALESNIGLNTICQFVSQYDNELPQGLGTGSLFTNNFPSDLTVKKGYIYRNIK